MALYAVKDFQVARSYEIGTILHILSGYEVVSISNVKQVLMGNWKMDVTFRTREKAMLFRRDQTPFSSVVCLEGDLEEVLQENLG